MRITFDRCGKDRMLNEVHTPARQRAMSLRDIIANMRHDGCGGRAGRVELLTGIGGPRRGALPWLNPTGVSAGRGTRMAQAWSLHQHGHRAVGDEQSSGEQKKENSHHHEACDPRQVSRFPAGCFDHANRLPCQACRQR
jgi:hypothetical protein